MRERRRFAPPGTSPGTLHAPPDAPATAARLEVFHYDADHLEEAVVAEAEELARFRDAPGITWINLVGVHDVGSLSWLGEAFGLHPLALEDVLHVGQRPKQEEYENHLFIVLRRVTLGKDGIENEQISLFLGKDFVITCQERPGDDFEPVRERLRQGRGRVRRSPADYLAYALLDAVVDQFFPLLEHYGEELEDVEDELIDSPSHATLADIHRCRKELLMMRRTAWPQREVIAGLERHESPLIRKETRIYLRDCYDHCVQILDILESYRDMATGMLDVYLSSVSNRMNEVMKALTVMASIFIPLTFLAGIYGMNFDTKAGPWNMPELGWQWGYPAFWAVTVVVGGGLVWYFRRKDWL